MTSIEKSTQPPPNSGLGGITSISREDKEKHDEFVKKNMNFDDREKEMELFRSSLEKDQTVPTAHFDIPATLSAHVLPTLRKSEATDIQLLLTELREFKALNSQDIADLYTKLKCSLINIENTIRANKIINTNEITILSDKLDCLDARVTRLQTHFSVLDDKNPGFFKKIYNSLFCL